ncbi:YopX family protein [Aneurinibacillus aneurinilyticus]|uniref:YopX family protein n=1 Tax=Aneurinibacillus aneurinilyticus TaxID=1391 RepID=UPI002E212144|nr:YopX family protein [Aneurinibacillus aneurinilyticus]
MRKINLRAWDKREKVMGYLDEIWNNKWYAEPAAPGCSTKSVFSNNNLDAGKRDLVVMQSTGLKDRNGREIYEGDIVVATNRLHECEVKENVHFLNGCFMFGNWNAHEFFNRHQSIKVISNIYENPVLLEEQHG